MLPMRSLITAAVSTLIISLAGASALAQQGLGIGTGGVAGLWATNCQKCHAERGQGGGAGTRSLLDDEWHDGPAGATPRAMFDNIKNGMKDAGMEPFGQTLKNEEIWALVAYVYELRDIDARKRGEGAKPGAGGVYTSKHHSYKVENVISAGLSVPWSVDFIPADGTRDGGPPAGSMLVTERSGKLRVFADGKLSEPIANTPAVRNRGQGGLMDVAPHTDYAKNGWVYLSFSHSKEIDGRNMGMTKIVRGRIKNNAWTDEETIFEAKPEHYVRTDLHFGCRIVFDAPDAQGRLHIYWCIGERFLMDHAQELARPNGKVHRLWDDGTVPDDNPFISNKNAYPSIWSYGHRNPQGLAFDLAGNLWDTEHGPRGGDEVNLIKKGANYGWPLVSFGMNYNGSPFRTPWPEVQGVAQEIAMPSYVWLPSIGACGLDCVRGGAFPKWSGDLVAGGLSGMNVDRFRFKDGVLIEREELLFKDGRVRDVICGPEGAIYVVLNDPDSVVRLMPTN
jgi:aldose sugar dehydrogenase